MIEAGSVHAASTSNSGSGAGSLLFPLLLVVLLVGWFFFNSRRRKQLTQQTQQQLEPGVLVMTTAGLFATVVDTAGGDVLLEIAPGVVCRYVRAAIARVVPAEDGFGDPVGPEALDAGGLHDQVDEAGERPDGGDPPKPSRPA